VFPSHDLWRKKSSRESTDRYGEIPQGDCSECEVALAEVEDLIVDKDKKIEELNSIIETHEDIEDMSTEYLLAVVDKRVADVEL
jgi:hypothetical protein